MVDLGIDVKPERFIHAVRNYEPDILLLSGVLSTAQDSMANTVALMEAEGVRSQVKLLLGGLCSNQYLMQSLGADGWAYDSKETVRFCKEVMDAKQAAQ